MKKKFLISIDTEGDNLWEWERGNPITTENALYLPRFQNLCNEYGFKPTYLTNYEMASDDKFVQFAGMEQKKGNCEIGMHLHAWNCPPEYKLQLRCDGVQPGSPYLIEFTEEQMRKKIEFMTIYLRDRFGTKPITHRAGRWAMDDRYFRLLSENGYLVDCSVTPGLNWQSCPGETNGSAGTDYTGYKTEPYSYMGITEIPVTVRKNHRVPEDDVHTIKHYFGKRYRAWKGYGKVWLRPNGNNLEEMIALCDYIYKSRSEYIMFMLHSSEFMPGGSPTFDNDAKIEKLYSDLYVLFEYISKRYDGMTIGAYGMECIERGRY